MEAEIDPPRERTCELCGRQDVWDESVGNWVIATDDDGERRVGNRHCIHEWDINGRYNPIAAVDGDDDPDLDGDASPDGDDTDDRGADDDDPDPDAADD